MKNLVTLALVASVVGAPAMARPLNVNSQDVNQGRTDGRNLTTFQANKLRLEVGLARFVARTLRNKQGLMNNLGVDGYKNWQTITIGAGTAAAEFAAGLAAIKYVPEERLFALNSEVRDLYTKMNVVEDKIKGLQAQKDPKLGQAVETPNVVAIEKEIETLTGNYDMYRTRARTLEEAAPLWKRSLRPLRVGFAYTAGALLIYDAATHAAQITFDGSRDDRNLLGSLDKFIEEGRATLADRE